MSTMSTSTKPVRRVTPSEISVTFEIDDLHVHQGYRIDSVYVEEFWSGRIGPTGIGLLRLLARRATAGECERPLVVVELADTLGVSCSGWNSPFWNSLRRLVRFGAGYWTASDHSAVTFYSHMPPVPLRHRQQWSPTKEARYSSFVSGVDHAGPAMTMPSTEPMAM